MTNYTSSKLDETLLGYRGAGDNATTETIVIVNCVLNAPLMIIAIMGNTLILATVITTPSLRSTSMAMLCSLAVSDFLVGLFVQPVFIAKEITAAYSVERLYNCSGFVLCGVSLSTMTAISIDRYMALMYSLRYQTCSTLKAKLTFVSILTIWIYNMLFSIVYFQNWPVYFTIQATCACLFLCLTAIFYIRIYCIARRHQVQIQVQQEAVKSSPDTNSLNRARMIKKAFNNFVFYIAMILCYFPVTISMFIASASFKDVSRPWHLANTIVHLNSAINPILYCWRLAELRGAVLKTIRKMACKQGPQGWCFRDHPSGKKHLVMLTYSTHLRQDPALSVSNITASHRSFSFIVSELKTPASIACPQLSHGISPLLL